MIASCPEPVSLERKVLRGKEARAILVTHGAEVYAVSPSVRHVGRRGLAGVNRRRHWRTNGYDSFVDVEVSRVGSKPLSDDQLQHRFISFVCRIVATRRLGALRLRERWGVAASPLPDSARTPEERRVGELAFNALIERAHHRPRRSAFVRASPTAFRSPCAHAEQRRHSLPR